MTRRLMTVHAHPDDESSKGAATLARYSREGVDVLVVTCTGGERGDVLNAQLDTPETRANLSEILVPGTARRHGRPRHRIVDRAGISRIAG